MNIALDYKSVLPILIIAFEMIDNLLQITRVKRYIWIVNQLETHNDEVGTLNKIFFR